MISGGGDLFPKCGKVADHNSCCHNPAWQKEELYWFAESVKLNLRFEKLRDFTSQIASHAAQHGIQGHTL